MNLPLAPTGARLRIYHFPPSTMDSVHGELPYGKYFNGDVSKQVKAGTYPECRELVEESLKGEIGTVKAELHGEKDWRDVRVDKKYVQAKMDEYDAMWEGSKPKKAPAKKVTAKSSSKKK